MSKKYLTGKKRLQIINKWFRGIEGPKYDVLPTHKEGKYIVKLQEEPIPIGDTHEATEQEEPKHKSKAKPVSKIKAILKTYSNTSSYPNQYYEPTINIEILNKLKLLGE